MKLVRLPRVGQSVRIQWLDAQRADDRGWEYGSLTDDDLVVEVTQGIYLGMTTDNKLRVVPTVSIKVPTEIVGRLGRLDIPHGCIFYIERIPKLIIRDPRKKPKQ